jgi:ubiquinone/menaquinone biosynthesis C-methylase UbiE
LLYRLLAGREYVFVERSIVEDSEQILNWYQTFTPDCEQRKTWYGDVAQTYDLVRPKYDREFLERVVKVAGIPLAGNILEVGCGPGTATISFAKMGFSMVCLEPNLAACEIARYNSQIYPNVEIINTNFEEWECLDRSVDAIVAATSWHWVAPESKHLKAASALKTGGSLILLWNTAMQPPTHIFDKLSQIFSQYIPTFAKYKDPETQLSEARIFAKSAIDSLLFVQLVEEYQSIEVNYPIDDYLELLTTYSPCIALSPEQRHDFLSKLRQVLEQNCDEQIPLSYLSIFHIARKS